MRLFVAIALDQTTRDRVVAAQRRLVAALGTAAKSLRVVGAEQLHLTLAFVGEVEESGAAEIAHRLAVEIEQPPFTLTLGGAGVFPVRGASRVLWLGVLDGLEEVTDLHQLVVRRLTGSGVAVDRKRFSPHLTLGRWRAGEGRVSRQIALALDRRADRVIAQMAVNEVTLFQSRLSATGSAYTALARTRLSCPSSS